MPYLLQIDASPQGPDASKSRQLGKAFIDKFTETHAGVEVQVLDLAVNAPPHVDTELLFAGWVPEEARPPSQQAKHEARLALINQAKNAEYILVTTPMYNWNVPSAFKAWVDHLVMPGYSDTSSKFLAGKKITILLATGGAYSPGSWHPEWDFASGYLKHVFTVLGADDVVLITTEYTLAGIAHGMETLVDKKEASFVEATAAAVKRAESI